MSRVCTWHLLALELARRDEGEDNVGQQIEDEHAVAVIFGVDMRIELEETGVRVCVSVCVCV
jgi:hypothetical protein